MALQFTSVLIIYATEESWSLATAKIDHYFDKLIYKKRIKAKSDNDGHFVNQNGNGSLLREL
jgi:hypothetical protein